MMPKRVTVTLADTVAAKLQRWSEARGQPLATVAGIAIELAVKDAEKSGEFPPEGQSEQSLEKKDNP